VLFTSPYFSQNLYIPNPINAAGIVHSNSTITHFRTITTISFGTFSVTSATGPSISVPPTECLTLSAFPVPHPQSIVQAPALSGNTPI
jgi:hypothetical protein